MTSRPRGYHDRARSNHHRIARKGATRAKKPTASLQCSSRVHHVAVQLPQARLLLFPAASNAAERNERRPGGTCPSRSLALVRSLARSLVSAQLSSIVQRAKKSGTVGRYRSENRSCNRRLHGDGRASRETESFKERKRWK